MKRVIAVTSLLALLLVSAWWLSCSNRPLRGQERPSPDGKTYLVISDDDGGECGELKVDGRSWQGELGEPVQVEPGVHEVSCGSGPGIAIEVRSGTTFVFDYWGP